MQNSKIDAVSPDELRFCVLNLIKANFITDGY